MIVFTETIAGLVSELAKFSGNVTTEISEDRIVVSVTPHGACKCAREAKSVGRSALAGWKPGKRVSDLDPEKLKRLPKVGAKKPGPKPGKKWVVENGVRVRGYAFNGETLSAEAWAKRYHCTKKAIQERFTRCGSPETTRNRSKFEKNSLKSKLARGGAK